METEQHYPVDQETAEAEFERFVELNEIDADESAMDAEDLPFYRKQRRRMVGAIMDGSLTIDEDGCPEYTPQHRDTRNKNPVKFRPRSGASLMASDLKKQSHQVAKTYAIMGDMTQQDPKRFAGMAGRDIKICETIFGFLMD